MASVGLILGGIIIGGFGFLLTLTILLAIIGLPLMLIGFILFIVGLVTGGERQVVYVREYSVSTSTATNNPPTTNATDIQPARR